MQFCTDRRRPFRVLFGALAAGLAVSACDSSTGPVVVAPEAAVNFQRLLVADAELPTARLLGLHDDVTLQTFALGAPASLVYRSHSGRFVGVQQRNANRVQFVDAGVWAQGSEAHRQAPALMGFMLEDGVPSYENVNGDWMSVFFDGSGIVRWFRESAMRAGTPSVVFEANTGGPHHGGAFSIQVNGQQFFAHSTPNPAGGSPNGVAVRNQQGQIVSQLANCPGLHGNNSIATGGVFGCNDGLVLVRASGNTAVAEKVTPSGDMAGLALRNAWASSGASFMLVQFAALPGQPAQRVLATLNPATGALARLPALPTGVVDHWRAIEPGKERIVLLGNNGTLFIYGSNRELQHTIAGVVPALPATGSFPHQVAVVEDLAAVASPYTGEVVLVNLNTGAQIRRIAVGGSPSRLAIAGALGAGPYTPHD
jgi:zinc transport system substrate-binding protein